MAARLADREAEVVSGSLGDDTLRQRVGSGSVDLLVALGGDGTMLRAVHLCAPSGVPILGINLGRLGFLIEVERDGWKEAVDRLLAGDFWLEDRMMLRARLHRGSQMIGDWDVLNECVVGRGKMVRLVRLVTEIDGAYLTTYAADALIAATPTGSTAYALAAGGPILPPDLRNILLVPVAPHLSIERAVVLHEGSSVRVTVKTDHEATLSVDGQTPVDLLNNDAVEVCASEHTAHFVRFQDRGYFYRNLTAHLAENTHPGAAR
jgi:NAD+ kinase